MKIKTTGKMKSGKGYMLKGKGYSVKNDSGKKVEFGTYIPAGVASALKDEANISGTNKYEDKRQMDAFKSWRKVHPNFMTPYLVKTYRGDGFFVEVSEGEDFEHRPMYGVSVVSITPDKTDSLGYKFQTSIVKEGINKPMADKNEAMAYAYSLSKKSKKELLK